MGLSEDLAGLRGRTITDVLVITTWRTDKEASLIRLTLDTGAVLQFDAPEDTEYAAGLSPIIIEAVEG